MPEKIVYQEKFRKPYPTIKQEYLPVFNHVPKGAIIKEVQIITTGTVDRNGKALDFQEMRVYFDVEKVQS